MNIKELFKLVGESCKFKIGDKVTYNKYRIAVDPDRQPYIVRAYVVSMTSVGN